MRNFLNICAKTPLLLYRTCISPLLPVACRFHPTCSAYALEAIETHGAGRGLLLAFRRILKCHPWHRGPRLDSVPQKPRRG